MAAVPYPLAGKITFAMVSVLIARSLQSGLSSLFTKIDGHNLLTQTPRDTRFHIASGDPLDRPGRRCKSAAAPLLSAATMATGGRLTEPTVKSRGQYPWKTSPEV